MARYLLAVVLASMLIGAAGAASTGRSIGLDDLEGVKSGEVAVLSMLDLRADGRLLAVERGGALSVVDVSSGRITKELGEGLLPQWSPDGSTLAFYSHRSGTLQIWTWRGGAPRQLTRLPAGIDPDIETRMMGYISDAFHYCWSPTGDRIVFPSRVAFHVPGATVPGAPLVLTTTTPPSLTLQDVFSHPGGGTGGVIESRNGRDLSFRTPKTNEILFNELFVVDALTGKTTQLTEGRATAFDPSWSPDGRTIAFARVGAEEIIAAGKGEIALFNLATHRTLALDSGAGIKFRPRWSPDGQRIAYLISKSFESEASIRTINATGDGPATSVELGGPVLQYDWDRTSGGNRFVVSYGSEDGSASNTPAGVRDVAEFGRALAKTVGPWAQNRHGEIAWIEDEAGPDVWLSSTDRAASRKLLSLSSMQDFEPARSETVTWRDSRGEALDGWLLYPANYKNGRRYPLIVDVYPFPGSRGWMNPMSGNRAWASAGYMVFKPRPRAPHSAPNCAGPPAFCAAGQGPAALGVMVDDVMSGIAELDHRGLIDHNRMCLYGHSNGGGVVDYLVTRTDAFQCAVSVAPVLPNWLGTPFLWYDSLGLMSRLAGAKPWENPDAYVQLSAVLQADKVKTPMLLADGDEDGAFLLGSIEWYGALRGAGANVTLLRYPGQGHALTGPALHDFWQREMAFFSVYLKPDGE